MQTVLPPTKSTTVRSDAVPRPIQLGFHWLERLSPTLTLTVLNRVFASPKRHPWPEEEQRWLALAEHLGQPDLPTRRRLHDRDPLEPAMAGVAARAGVRYLSVMQAICPGGACRTTTPEGLPMQWDEGHLSKPGSLYVGRRLRDQEDRPPR